MAPGEFTNDAASVVQIAQQQNGQVKIINLIDRLNWQKLRAQHALDQLVQSGTVWFDQHDSSYWFPALFSQ